MGENHQINPSKIRKFELSDNPEQSGFYNPLKYAKYCMSEWRCILGRTSALLDFQRDDDDPKKESLLYYV